MKELFRPVEKTRKRPFPQKEKGNKKSQAGDSLRLRLDQASSSSPSAEMSAVEPSCSFV